MKTPYDATDWRGFLRLRLDELGLRQGDVSQAVGNSASWISNLMSRRRHLDAKWVPGLIRALRLDEELGRFFAALVDLEGGSAAARRNAAAVIAGVRRQRASLESLRDEALLAASTWYVGAVIELARCEAFRPDPAWIARTLFPPITPEQADEALTTLLRLGILVHGDDGRIVVPDPDVWFPSTVTEDELAESLARNERDRLDHAKDSLRAHRHNERRIIGITMAVSERGNATVIARLKELEREVASLAESDPDVPNRVYYLGLQWFPVSEFTDWDQSIETSNHGPLPDIEPDTTE